MSNAVSQALSLLDSAEAALNKVRLETPVDYYDTSEGRDQVIGQLRKIDGETLDAAMRAFVKMDQADQQKVGPRVGTVQRMFDYVAQEAIAGRLPQFKEAPWPPAELTREDSMRADADESAAEPATNGYESE